MRDIGESSLLYDLRDPEFAAAFLEEVLRQGSLESFLFAVRNVAQANGGMKRLADEIGCGRESLYKSLSRAGNPQFKTVQAILREAGLRFSVRKIRA